ncbi:CRISPR-associated helicase Cas3' [Neolewinella antarctica]|uniref:CRISPR-associated endonuclease/helicase Cas3 n=1 Tax=Neolewinella antarctica TaxID=442734 RepID=A0ABX0X8Y6_9BACT|nr:CRISPR-associated helicase Cas3' [Neolewinella antarctica]NJC25692.1 CRISPR-associated endonuclease/helicase Cas3 [Neolewinella antarctica]
MKELSKYFGKPSGITLRKHTDNVHRFGAFARHGFPFLASKYKNFFGLDLDILCWGAEEKHDYGKAYSVWNKACAKDVLIYESWLQLKGHSLRPFSRKLHAEYEQDCYRNKRASAPHLLKAYYRHEFASCFHLLKHEPEIAHEILAAIAAHHGKLSLSKWSEKRWREDGVREGETKGPFLEIYNKFKQVSDSLAGPYDFTERVRLRYRYSAIRALLQLADTRASRWEGMGEEGTVALHNFQRPRGYGYDGRLRPVQKAAKSAAGAWRTILRAPTGSGKTYASLLWAEEQILGPNPRADRLVIAMPTRFTSNALRNSVLEHLPEVGLHHSSAFYNLNGEDGDRSFGSMAIERQKLAKYLAYPATVCTIDHLLACLTGTKEQHYSTFFFLANSCVVFDESDFYDEFVQANIQTLLKVFKILKVPTLIMSATVPDSARELYGVHDPIRTAPQPNSDRVIKNMHFTPNVAEPKDVENFIGRMIEAGEGIIYANTVARALAYYTYLSDRVEELPITIYHSRFTEVDKKRIEEELEISLGKTAHTQGKARGIVIMTQIGEMSINISSKLMLSDCCPWDRLAQRVGRLARFSATGEGRTEAEVMVVEPVDDKGEAYAWPYVEEVVQEGRNTFIPARAYARTREEIIQLAPQQAYRLTPDNLVEHTNALYPETEAFSVAAKANQDKYEDLIRDNWLLAGAVGSSLDESEIGTWKSRNIVAQVNVFTEHPPNGRFRNYQAMHDFALTHGVSCPVYKVAGEMRKVEGEGPAIRLTDIVVGYDQRSETIPFYVAEPGAYKPVTGLASLYGYDWTIASQL